MSQRKVGALDHPSRYGARSKGVFMRAAGFFFLDDGRRVAVGGTQRWTTTEGIAMRGNAPHVPPMQAILQLGRPSTPPLGAIEADELELAIAESLATAPEAPVAVAEAPAEAIADEGGARPDAPAPRRCVVCLDDRMVEHMVAPCNHLCLCAACAARVRRERLACPVCRHAQRGIVRVFL